MTHFVISALLIPAESPPVNGLVIQLTLPQKSLITNWVYPALVTCRVGLMSPTLHKRRPGRE